MATDEILVLKGLLEKIDSKEFDLESWKINAINVLERLFGSASHKIEQIKQLKYDFSSWSLRDASGSAGAIKKKAKVILESAIQELENFGLPGQKSPMVVESSSAILSLFEDELRGSQFRKLKEILNIDNQEDKKKSIHEILSEIESESKERILQGIISLLK